MTRVWELLDYWRDNPPLHILLQPLVKLRKRRKRRGGYENEDSARKAGVLPNSQNTVLDESKMDDWVREARADIRKKRIEDKGK